MVSSGLMAVRLLLSLLVLLPNSLAWSQSDRRAWLSQIARHGSSSAAVVGIFAAAPIAVSAESELPMALRSLTRLAPLKDKSLKGDKAGAEKSTSLPLDEVANRLARDLEFGSTGKGSYIVTGDLSGDIFMDSCSFIDPTNKVDSLQKYQKALTILFDPSTSQVDVLEAPKVSAIDGTIRARYRCRGTLKLPWHPAVSAFESDIAWTVDKDTGLISKQEQTWSKSAGEALRETFTPSFFGPPPMSDRAKPSNEPAVVTKLFDMVNGRRDADYSAAERRTMEAWIDEIAELNVPFQSQLLPGTWRLVYLRPESDGSGIDRRIPFPEFPFNDSFQIFQGFDSSNDAEMIRNVGQVLGPNVFVAVFGDLVDVNSSREVARKRLQAIIHGGKLCFVSDATCLGLPISGVGIFESVYLGGRLRIGQNVNGGGALVVQVRVDSSSRSWFDDQ
jgi:Uncharacterized conserved protein (DUF2358)